jgi:hypothetical protein
MYYKIEVSFILIHFLKNQTDCTVSDLVQKKMMIEKEIPSVYIDISRNSILHSIYYFPEIFELRNDRIAKRKDSSKFFEEPLIEYFNVDVDISVRSKIINLLNKG